MIAPLHLLPIKAAVVAPVPAPAVALITVNVLLENYAAMVLAPTRSVGSAGPHVLLAKLAMAMYAAVLLPTMVLIVIAQQVALLNKPAVPANVAAAKTLTAPLGITVT